MDDSMPTNQLMAFKAYLDKISPLSLDALGELSRLFRPAILKKGDFFVREGAYAKQIGFLSNGIVRSFFLSPDGKEYSKQFFVGPAIIGSYASLITQQPNRVAQQALTDCEVMIADYHRVEASYDQYHDLERLARKIAEFYFVEKEQKEIEMALLDADKRYLMMRDRFPGIEAMIPQYYIASYLGISPTQLSRIRKKLSQ